MTDDKLKLEQFLNQNGFTYDPKLKKYLCKFHDDHKASGRIYQDKTSSKWYYHCDSCGAHGDVHNLVDRWSNQVAGTHFAKANGKSTNSVTKSEKSLHKDILHKGSSCQPTQQHIYGNLDKLLSSVGNYTEAYNYYNPETKNIDLCIVRIEEGYD